MANSTTPPPPPHTPRPEYPRPQMVRHDWQCLNGAWEFAFDDADAGLAQGWHDGRALPGRITVPFAYQTALSGVHDTSIHEIVWYARSFAAPRGWQPGMDLLLHFGAVDYQTIVWVNGREVGHNRGGHVPFSFDIAPYLEDGHGENRITVRVVDRQDPHQPRGKQSHTGVPAGIDYYCTTGIWQTVWLEPAPPVRIDALRITPVADEDAFELRVFLHAPATGWRVEAEALDGDEVVGSAAADNAGATVRLTLAVPNARRWSPDAPHLYDVRVRLWQGRDTLLDAVESYAGMRDVRLRDGRLLLNGAPTFLAMVLDQGYWPDGGMTAPTDDALRADVEWCKRLGFNGARKHQKIEDPRWLYWCDTLGLLAWGEMPNARAWSPEAEERLLAEWERAVRRDVSHPCVVTWVPVNESMGFPGLEEHHPGQYAFVERVVALTRRLDPTRPVIDNDGWEHTDVTDILAIHDYTPTAAGLRARYADALRGGPLPPTVWYRDKPLFLRGSAYRGQPVMLTEVGGFLLVPPDLPEEKRDRLYRFYGSFRTPEELLQKYRDLMRGIADLTFLAGFCYTQLTDIEQEINGLLTYDRRPKVAPEEIAAIHRALLGEPMP
jgi:beta-galactosidase/beta-glucuronidase